MIVVRRKAGFDIGERCCKAGKIGLLRQITQMRARLQETDAAVGLDLARGDLQQCRFAGAVAADHSKS